MSIVIVVHLGGEGSLVDPWDGGGEDPRGGVQAARPAHRVDRQRQAAVADRGFQGRPALVVLTTVGDLTKGRYSGLVKERVQLTDAGRVRDSQMDMWGDAAATETPNFC